VLGRFIPRGALLSAVVLAVLSWTPGQHMVRTGMLSGEHFLAHLLAATGVAAAVRRGDLMLWTWLALVAYAGVLELGAIPGAGPRSRARRFRSQRSWRNDGRGHCLAFL
jgi:hypothetical protein